MNLSDFFKKKLNAPLVNIRKSWGAVRTDGVVFLRVWQDEIVKRNGGQYVRIAAHSKYPQDSDDFGWNERLRHIDLIRDNGKCYWLCASPKTWVRIRDQWKISSKTAFSLAARSWILGISGLSVVLQ